MQTRNNRLNSLETPIFDPPGSHPNRKLVYLFRRLPNRIRRSDPKLSAMNIFVAKLNFKTRKEDLEAAFAKFGQVTSCKIVRDKETGRSKGYGFIEMPDDTEANNAINALNEQELDGRVIAVKPANPKPAAQ